MANNRIQTTELDFDNIKASLKNYLQGQSQFSDYDFEGSGLSILMDLLAYNTHYNGLYLNLAVNESFLDSASKRASVVSRAREIGYTPKSAVASTAVVDVLATSSQTTIPNTLELPIHTPFTAQVDNTTYTFLTTTSYTAARNGSTFKFSNVVLREGAHLQITYDYSLGSRIIIPNPNVDRSTILVSVQPTNSTSSVVFTEASNIVDVSSTSLIYFLKELEDQTYELQFGDGNIGVALSAGDKIIITYMVCHGDSPNGARTFVYTGSMSNVSSVYVSTISSAVNGSVPETIDSIKWNAPRLYNAQNRCVTTEDYKTMIRTMFPEALDVSVWGGEDNTPPQYGKTFISIVPKTTDYLTDDQKSYILNSILRPRKILTILPEIVDPTYIRLELDCTFYYDPAKTTRLASELITVVTQTIIDYGDQHLNIFGGTFRYSNLSTTIDDAEASINSNITTLKMHRAVNPIYNTPAQYTVALGNPIFKSNVSTQSILSTGIYTTDSSNIVYIDDIPTSGSNTGILRLFYIGANGASVFIKNCGTVNYATGTFIIEELTIVGLASPSFDFTIKGQSNDVISTFNQFVRIDPALITISAIAESATSAFQFTSSRN